MRRRSLLIAPIAALAVAATLVLAAPVPVSAAPASISGRVVDAEGTPLAGIVVGTKPHDANGPYEPSTTTTAADGSYRLHASSGTVMVAPAVEGRVQLANGRLDRGRGTSDPRYLGGSGGTWLWLLSGEQETGVDFVAASRGSARIAGTVSCAQPPGGTWPLPALHMPQARIELIDDAGLVVAEDSGVDFELAGIASGTYTMRATSVGSCPSQVRYWSPTGVSETPVEFHVAPGAAVAAEVELAGMPQSAGVRALFSTPERTAPADSPHRSGYEVRLYRDVDGRWQRVRPRLETEPLYYLMPGGERQVDFGALVEGTYAVSVGERLISEWWATTDGIVPVCPWYSGGATSMDGVTPFEVVGGSSLVLPHVTLRACPTMPTGTVTLPDVPLLGGELEPSLSGWAPGARASNVEWVDTHIRARSIDATSSLALTDDLRGTYPVGEVVVSAPGFASQTVEVVPSQRVRQESERLAGEDRFATAASVSRLAHPGTAPVVYVASGTSFPDGLAAGPAAAHEGGPVLLTLRDQVPASTIAEIERLRPDRIVIVGGTPTISAQAAAQLAALAPQVERVGGADRFETSRMLAERAFEGASWAVVATGASFPDALAAGGAAGRLDAPLVLVRGDAGADPAASALLGRLGVTDVLVAGAFPSVSLAMSESFEVAGMRTHLAAGADRYQTASFLAQFAFQRGSDEVLVASGATFVDALAGSAAAASMGVPMILVHPACQTAATVEALNALGSPRLVILGGEPTVSSAAAGYGTCAGVAPTGMWRAPGEPR